MRKILPLTSSFLEIKKGADSKYIHKKKKANAWFSQKKSEENEEMQSVIYSTKPNKTKYFLNSAVSLTLQRLRHSITVQYKKQTYLLRSVLNSNCNYFC